MSNLMPTITPEAYANYRKNHEVSLRLYLPDPELWVLDGFLTDAECNALVGKYIQDTYALGYVSDDGTIEVDGRRKAKGRLLESDDPLNIDINARLEELTLWSQYKAEPTNFVHYKVGDFIRPHFDFLGDTQYKGVGGQRVGTGVIYLNDKDAEGATCFEHSGLKIYPKKGTLILFNYPNATTDSLSKHCSEDFTEGEKFVLVKWFRAGFIFETTK